MKKILSISLATASTMMLLAFSCTSNEQGKVASNDQQTQKTIYLVKFNEPSNGTLFKLGDVVSLKLKLTDEKVNPDSIVLFVNSNRIGKISNLSYSLNTEKLKLGTQTVRATAYKDGLFQTASVSVKLKSNVAPKIYTFRVVKTFPHDPEAYTQGLIYKDGFLYEGTGQKGSSSIRKVELETGKVLQSINLESKHFGEGITLFNDKLFQLTWTSEVGFIYDFATFKQVGSFNFNTQGWGLTNNDVALIMSNGSNIIRFMEPSNFSETHRIEVYNDREEVNQLNELELINGDIYANVYQTDNIVIINPETGIVKGIINFKGILKSSERTGNEDVLNGIAWDATGKRLFITGKLWPKLFQVELVEK